VNKIESCFVFMITCEFHNSCCNDDADDDDDDDDDDEDEDADTVCSSGAR